MSKEPLDSSEAKIIWKKKMSQEYTNTVYNAS